MLPLLLEASFQRADIAVLLSCLCCLISVAVTGLIKGCYINAITDTDFKLPCCSNGFKFRFQESALISILSERSLV
jgi:hypothetical protein